MIVSCSLLLAVATLVAKIEPGEHIQRPAASVSGESGDAYRDRARSAVRDVLARREFSDLHSDPYAAWRQFFQWIGGLFDRLGDAIRNLPPWLYWIVITWMVLTLLAILAHLTYTLVSLLHGTKRADRAAQDRDNISGELLGIQDLNFDKVYAEARRLLTAGEWTAATRYFYVAAILWLDHEGAIVFKRSKTNADYVAELARAGVPPLGGLSTLPAKAGTPAHGTPAHAFRRLTELFEPIVYGGRQPTDSNMNDISTTVESLLHEPAVAGPR